MSAQENDLLDRASETYDAKKFEICPDAFKDLNSDAIEPQLSGDDICFRSEQSEFKYLDDHMNDVYQAAHFILPLAEFAKVQVEQREWLKKRDAAGSIAEKSKLTSERTDALQDVALVKSTRR